MIAPMKNCLALGYAVLAAAILAAPASAGRFTNFVELAPDDAQQIKHLAVVSFLGDTLRGAKRGLTLFQSKSFDAKVPDWGLDAVIRTDMQSRVVASRRIKGSVDVLVVPVSDKKVILDLAREGGFDAVIAALPERVPEFPMVDYSPAILSQGDLYACAGMAIHIWRVSDGKQIAVSQPGQCSFGMPLKGVAWHDNWNDFTDDEKRTTLEGVRAFILQKIAFAFDELALQPHRPGT